MCVVHSKVQSLMCFILWIFCAFQSLSVTVPFLFVFSSCDFSWKSLTLFHCCRVFITLPWKPATELISKLNFLEDEDQDTPTAMSTNPFEEPDDDPHDPNHLNPFGDPDEEGMDTSAPWAMLIVLSCVWVTVTHTCVALTLRHICLF